MQPNEVMLEELTDPGYNPSYIFAIHGRGWGKSWLAHKWVVEKALRPGARVLYVPGYAPGFEIALKNLLPNNVSYEKKWNGTQIKLILPGGQTSVIDVLSDKALQHLSGWQFSDSVFDSPKELTRNDVHQVLISTRLSDAPTIMWLDDKITPAFGYALGEAWRHAAEPYTVDGPTAYVDIQRR